jgi:hypothetical protein
MTRNVAAAASVTLLLALCACAGAEVVVGPAVAVAPRVRGTRSQAWPSIAWSKHAGCWLVVWREGWLNEGETDIWSARIRADGKAMDPAGIRITDAPDIQDRPRAASDGKDFLVVWEDLRKGGDWDVYAARVSAGGKRTKADGFALAAGEHNQVRPDVAFAGGRYVVAWMSFQPGGQWTRYGDRVAWPNAGFYRIRAGLVAPQGEGRLLGRARTVIEKPATNTHMPVVAAAGEHAIVQAFSVHGYRCVMNRRRISPATGEPVGAQIELGQPQHTRKMHLGFAQSQASQAFAATGGLSVHSDRTNLCAIWPVDAEGKATTEFPTAVLSAGPGYSSGKGFTFVYQRRCLSHDGERFLCVTDNVSDDGGSDVVGWYLTAEGKALSTGAFAIARGGRRNVQAACAGGPKGVSLVVYRAERGMDDAGLMARLVTMRAVSANAATPRPGS